MSKSEEYRANAVECLRRANLARDATDKRAWFDMGQHWLELLRFRRTAQDSGRSDRSATISALQDLKKDYEHKLTEERRGKGAMEQPPLWLRSRNTPRR